MTTTVTTSPTVVLQGVSRWFGQKVAVSEISAEFGAGVTGLLGPNGAGKTTLLRVLTGLIRPSEGAVSVFGSSPRSDPSVYSRMALVPEDENVYGFLSAAEFVIHNARLQKLADPAGAAQRVLEMVDLTDVADRKLAGFSKGMRQRAKVAAALVHDPEIVILDEPLNGTDPVQRAHLTRIFVDMGRQGRTVIVSSHVLHEVERMADRVIAMVDGRLAASGTVPALRSAMSDIPLQIRIDCNHPRRLAAALVEREWVGGINVEETSLHIRSLDADQLGRALPALAQKLDIRVTRVDPEDESLESVFRYLVEGR
ncbi:MAG: ABC transporter ATP-binding protein [Acidimicrobiia bacterium]|nr:ABC transporter ATP-binding protein [Acidimicrobiia bacterium]MDH3397146.1 ABC transporter ATP-binding protein [Acidimicrobiia bacterium]MDH5615791.1 ABC transporter ATP-binding protein [Acidimicrobiia bacterium]